MNMFTLASFILALLTGSPLPEQEGHEMKGEDLGRQTHICQAASLSDVQEESPTEDPVS